MLLARADAIKGASKPLSHRPLSCIEAVALHFGAVHHFTCLFCTVQGKRSLYALFFQQSSLYCGNLTFLVLPFGLLGEETAHVSYVRVVCSASNKSATLKSTQGSCVPPKTEPTLTRTVDLARPTNWGIVLLDLSLSPFFVHRTCGSTQPQIEYQPVRLSKPVKYHPEIAPVEDCRSSASCPSCLPRSAAQPSPSISLAASSLIV